MWDRVRQNDMLSGVPVHEMDWARVAHSAQMTAPSRRGWLTGRGLACGRLPLAIVCIMPWSMKGIGKRPACA